MEFGAAPIAKRAVVRPTGFLVTTTTSVADVDKPAGDVGLFIKVIARPNPVMVATVDPAVGMERVAAA